MQLLLKTSYGKVAFQEVSHLVFHQRYQIFRNITQWICTACQAAATKKEGKGILIHSDIKEIENCSFFDLIFRMLLTQGRPIYFVNHESKKHPRQHCC